MIIDGILVIILIASLGYGLYIVIRKFPQLANVNVDSTPSVRQAYVKRQILEDKLRRDIHRRWQVFKGLFKSANKKKIAGFFSSLYSQLKDLEQEYRIAKKKDLSSQVSRTQSIDELIITARQALNSEEYDRAERILISALKIDEYNIGVYTLLASVYREKEDYEHAKETLEFILQLTSNEDAAAYSNLADVALKRGDLHRAQEDYLKSISLDQNNYKYCLDLAEIYYATGENDKAQEMAEKALTLSSSNPKILDFLIENSIILQDKNRADEYLAKLIESNPQNGKIPLFKKRIAKLGK